MALSVLRFMSSTFSLFLYFNTINMLNKGGNFRSEKYLFHYTFIAYTGSDPERNVQKSDRISVVLWFRVKSIFVCSAINMINFHIPLDFIIEIKHRVVYIYQIIYLFFNIVS